MIDSISLGLSGMLGHERGLNVIGNNVANMSSPGFRGSDVTFSDVFSGATLTRLPDGTFVGEQGTGRGLDASHTRLDMTAGQNAPTGRDLDVALQGAGWFVLQDEAGGTLYTRNGGLEFDTNHQLVVVGQKTKVMALDANRKLVPIDSSALQTSAAKATTTVSFTGTLSLDSSSRTDPNNPTDPTNPAGGADFTLNSVSVFDKAGHQHTLTLTFTKQTSSTTPTTPGATDWAVSVLENDAQIGSGTVEYDVSGSPVQDSTPLHISLSLQGTDPTDVAFDFTGTNAQHIGTTSSLTFKSQDGFASGTIATETFDTHGTLKITYTNGQSVNGPQLALAEITDDGGLVELSNAQFAYRGSQQVGLRVANADLQVQAQTLERSNVDLTQQFSELILMQRGYQASSQVVSTANDMLQQLLDMRASK